MMDTAKPTNHILRELVYTMAIDTLATCVSKQSVAMISIM